MIKFYILILILSIASPAFCQDTDFFKPNHVRRELKAVKIINSLKIDGKPGLGLVGSGGDYSDNGGESVTAIKPGWKLDLYLSRPWDGACGIVRPNGFTIITRPATVVNPADGN